MNDSLYPSVENLGKTPTSRSEAVYPAPAMDGTAKYARLHPTHMAGPTFVPVLFTRTSPAWACMPAFASIDAAGHMQQSSMFENTDQHAQTAG